MVRQVEASQHAGDGLHLPADIGEESPIQECPSASDSYLECLCVPNSPTRHLISAWGGANLIIVPLSLLQHWFNTWNAFVKTDFQGIRPILLRGHQQTNPNVAPVEQKAGALRIQETRMVLEAEATDDAIRRGWASPSARVHQAALAAYKREEVTSPPRVEQLTVITTPGSFESRVQRPLSLSKSVRTPSSGPGSRTHPPVITVRGDRWRRVIRDESHEERGFAQTVKIMGALIGRPPCWMASGTPFDKSPADLVHYIRVLEQARWQSDKELRHCTASALADLGKRFKGLQESQKRAANPVAKQQLDGSLQAISSELGRILASIGFIRRTANSKWDGQPLLDLPPHQQQDIDCPLGPAEKALLEDLRAAAQRTADQVHQGDSGAQHDFKRSFYRFRLSTTLPGLAALYNREGKPEDFVWTSRQMQEQQWEAAPEQTPIGRELEFILGHCPRWTKLRDLIDGRARKADGTYGKIVIMSYFPIVIFTLTLVRQDPPSTPELLANPRGP